LIIGNVFNLRDKKICLTTKSVSRYERLSGIVPHCGYGLNSLLISDLFQSIENVHRWIYPFRQLILLYTYGCTYV